MDTPKEELERHHREMVIIENEVRRNKIGKAKQRLYIRLRLRGNSEKEALELIKGGSVK